MFKTVLLTYLFILFFYSGFSQEKSDTLDFRIDYTEKYINPIIFDIDFFNIYYPLSGDFTVKNRMNNMFFKELDIFSKYQSFTYSSNNFYQYYSNGFHFWENNVPLMLGASIHLNEVFGWDKLDVFMDAQGGLYNVYDYNKESNVFISTNEKAFSWNAGAGVGYKVSKGNTIFIKSSVSMKNLSPVGNSNMSGVNMKF